MATTNNVHKQEGNKQMMQKQHLGPWFWEDAAAQDWVSDDVLKAFGLTKDADFNGPMAAIWRYLHPMDAQKVETHRFDPFIEFSEHSFSFEFRLKPPSSSEYLHIRRTSEVIKRYASGRPSKIIGNFYLLHPESSQESAIANISPDRLYIIKTDYEGKYTDANEFFLQRFELTKEDIVGTSSLEHIFEADHPVCNAAVVEAFSKPGERVQVTFRKPHPSQGIIWTDWEFEAILDEEGRLEGITCFGIDITESKRLASELEKTQATLASIFSSMDEVVWSVQLPEYKTLYTSPSVEKLYEVPLEIFLNNSHLWETFIHPEDRFVVDTINKAIAKGEGYNQDYRIFTKNGVLKCVNNHAKVVFNEKNEAIRLDGVLKDITERKNAEKLVQSKQQQLEDVFDSMEEVVWSRRIADRSFIFVSPSVYKVFGVTQEAFLEDPDLWKKMAHPDDQKVIERIRTKSRKSGAFDEEYRIIATDGSVKWVNHRGQLSYDDLGNPTVLSGLFKDISSKKEAELAVVEGREKYRNLFHHSVVGKIKLDYATSRVLESNPAIEKLLGYTSEEFMKLSMKDLSMETYKEVDLDTRAQLQEFGRSIGVQKHYMHRDGTPIPVLVSAFMMEEDGRSVVWSNVQDYRRVYEQNKALEESENRLEMALNATMAGTWDTNLLAETADYDERWANILGLNPEKVKSTGYELWLSLLHPEDSERITTAAHAHVAGETPMYEAEYRLKHQDGHYIWVKERGKVVEWTTEGQPSRMVGTLLDISSEKQAMSKLEQSEADLRETQRTAKIGSWLYNSLTNRYELSAIACEIYGLPEHTQLSYEDLVNYFHPDDQKTFKDANFDMAVGFEHRVMINNELRWVFVKSKPYTKDGCLYTHKGIVQDITDRKLAEESLREQELRFRTFIENASDLICTVSLRGDIEFMSPNVLEMTGFTVAEAVGQKLIEYLHPDDLPVFLEAMTQIQYKEMGVAEYRLRHKQGGWIWVQTTIKVIYPSNGYPYALCFARNITLQKERQEQIERLSLVASKSTNAIIICDQEARIEWVNDGFVRQTGYTLDEIVGKKPGSFLQGPKTSPNDIDKIRKGLASGKPFSQSILNYHKNGETYWLDIHMTPMYGEQGELTGFIAVENDITERKLRENEMQRMLELTQVQNRRLQNFTYIVSHNIRSHAANFQGLLDMLELDLEAEEQEQYKGMMTDTSKKLLETISILNEVVSIHQATKLPKEQVIVLDSIQKSWKKVFPVNHPTQAKLQLDIPKDFTLYFPVKYFSFILDELLSNTNRYRDPKHPLEVNITAKNNQEYDVITISDNGLGINLERHKERIFGLFQVFHQHQEARGIGLFMVKNRMESCGGRVEVESEPGKGTTLVLKFLNQAHAAIFENMGG